MAGLVAHSEEYELVFAPGVLDTLGIEQLPVNGTVAHAEDEGTLARAGAVLESERLLAGGGGMVGDGGDASPGELGIPIGHRRSPIRADHDATGQRRDRARGESVREKSGLGRTSKGRKF